MASGRHQLISHQGSSWNLNDPCTVFNYYIWQHGSSVFTYFKQRNYFDHEPGGFMPYLVRTSAIEEEAFFRNAKLGPCDSGTWLWNPLILGGVWLGLPPVPVKKLLFAWRCEWIYSELRHAQEPTIRTYTPQCFLRVSASELLAQTLAGSLFKVLP